jgi:hypothetical protein
MKTLTIQDLSRNEELNRTSMAAVRGGLTSATTYTARFYAGMTVGDAIAESQKHAASLHQYLSNQS